MNYRILLLAIPLLLLTVVSASAAIQVEPANIEETVLSSKTVEVKISNDLNVSVSVEVELDVPHVTVSSENFDVGANGSKTITVTLRAPDGTGELESYSGRITYHYEYTIDNSTYNGTVVQNVTVHYGGIVIAPSRLDVETVEGEDYETHVTITNFLDTVVYVDIDYSGVVKGVSDDSFRIYPKSSEVLEVTLEGKSGTGYINYTFYADDDEVTETQRVDVEAYKPEEMEEYERIVNEIYLPDKIIINVENVKVGEPMTITVKGKINGSEVALKNVPVMFNDIVKFTDTNGKVSFTPDEAGSYTICVLDRFGNKKAEKVVVVSRSEYQLDVGDMEVGERLSLTLPENGTVMIYRDGELVKKFTGDKVEFTPSDIGVYKIVYDSNSYYGSKTFKVKGSVIVRLKNDLQGTQSVVYAGETTTFSVEYENGRGVSDLNVIVALPATAFGFDKNTAMMMALADPSKFTPPFNINTQARVTNGVLTVSIPEDTEGILVIKVEDSDLIKGGTYTFKIEKKPVNYTSYILSAIALVGVGSFAVVIGKNVGGVRDRLSSLRTRGGEPPL